MSHPTTTTIPPAGPIDILTTLIIALLAPMFLTATGGDLAAARAAAADSIEAYRARTHADLLAVAQIVAFSLSALGSLSLAMAPEIPIPLTLRLRGNANACNRSVEQNRRALLHPNRTDTAAPTDPPPFVPEPDQDAYEAQVIANVAATQQRIAETHARAVTPKPQPAPPATSAPTPAPQSSPAPTPAKRQASPAFPGPATTDQQWHALWASAAAQVAAEYTADIPNLPPQERRAASIRAAALNSCANDLLAGDIAPRLRPGALGPILRPSEI
jgi:outer membrane biosynthesis protein TonB